MEPVVDGIDYAMNNTPSTERGYYR
jgi:hypothetical protein